MHYFNQPSRRGTALIMTSIVIIAIAGMAITMTDLTISRYKEQRYRQAQVDLLAATESAANESINWLKNNPSVQERLMNMAITKPGYPTATKSTSGVLVSSSLPSGLPPVFPALIESNPAGGGGYTQGGTTSTMSTSTSSSATANQFGKRNACSVETKVIKVASSATPSVWDGTERFIIYTTAQFGDASNPEYVRRQRVETVITAVSTTTSTTTTTTTSVPTPAFPFTRGLFSVNGYDVKGTAETDSWNSDKDGDGIADTPYVRPSSYTVGGPNSKGDLGSNGTLGSGAYNTSKVHGTATPNANAQIPTVTYNPPTSGFTAVGSIAGDKTLTGSGTGTTIFKTPSVDHKNRNTLTISGTGTVVLYVDGAFNVGDIKFATGSTAKLVIYQNDISGKGASFNGQNTIGDASDPKRFMFITAFSGTGSNEMSLNGGASFSGVVLAPNAGIKFNGNSNFYGSFVAKDFSGAVNGTFNFHYDESLAGLSWGSIMKSTTTTTTTTKPVLSMLSPTAWNISSVGYHDP